MSIILRDIYVNPTGWDYVKVLTSRFTLTLGLDAEVDVQMQATGSFPVTPEFRADAALSVDAVGRFTITPSFDAQAVNNSALKGISEMTLPSPLFISEIAQGGRGTIELDFDISGSATAGLAGVGSLSLSDIRLSGSGISGKAVGTGALTLDLRITGRVLTDLLNSSEPSKGMRLDMRMSGRAFAGSIATGNLVLTDLAIAEFNRAILGSVGTGDIVFEISINGQAEVARYICLVLNSRNFSLTDYDLNLTDLFYFNGKYHGASTTEVFTLEGDTDDGTEIGWYFVTGEMDLEKDNVNRIRYAWVSYRPSGDLMLSVIVNETQYDYVVNALDANTDNAVKVKFGKGIKAKYGKFKVSNLSVTSAFFDRLRLFAEPVRKLR